MWRKVLMAILSVRIPQIGEGLQEARLVAVLKQPGEKVKRDEPIYQMETDKAVMDVESPYEGILLEWLGQPEEILAIGAEVARMEVATADELTAEQEPVLEVSGPLTPESAKPSIPPKTRAYAKEQGISDDTLNTIPAVGTRLLPSDIDAFLTNSPISYEEQALPAKQRLLASRLHRGSQLVVPGTMTVVASWSSVENARARYKAAHDGFNPSTFTIFAYAVTKALVAYPAFRSTLTGDDKIRTYKHVSLGIAVGLPGDELVLAVIEEADTLNWREFAIRAKDRIDLARTGKDQANEAVTVSLTNMQSFGLRNAVPVVVPPAIGTLFLGEAFNELDQESEIPMVRRVVNLTLTFDHRLVNGVGAAQFLNAVRANVEGIHSYLDC
jgi:pyruvate/2-oxoglutarate dehydrogenase complex dihydrolipoamide acyltransferase (E2) component